MPEDTVLMKSFKYFDLNNSGYVDKYHFFRAVEKIGVIVQGDKQREEIFKFYDLDSMNKIFYQEFISIIFGTKTGTTRNLSPKKVHAL